MTQPTTLADERFSQGWNCAQSVLSAFAQRYGLDEETAIKIAASFGGGMGRRGEACGAVTGALMALGLARAQATPEGKEEAYRLAGEFMRRFEEKHATILCRELVGFDIRLPEELQKARDSGAFKSVCPGAVHDAAEILHELLENG